MEDRGQEFERICEIVNLITAKTCINGDILNPLETRKWLAGLAEDVKKLPETMRFCRVDDDIIQRLAGWIGEVVAGLVEARPRTQI